MDGNRYPNHVTVKFVKQAREDSDHFIPLQVFVPVMEEIAADCGTQDVLAKYDPSSVQKLDGEIEDQKEPGINNGGAATTTTPSTVTSPTKVTATKTGVTAATAGKSATLSTKTGDSAQQVAILGLTGLSALVAAAYASLRRRLDIKEGEE